MSDPTFFIGTDLVEFDRRDLPIYQTEPASWDCFDEAPYGAPLDRLFGEPGAMHVDGIVQPEPVDITALCHDALVALAGFADDLSLAAQAFDHPENATTVETGAETSLVVHLHDGWSWDVSGVDWTFDFHV